MNSLNFEDRFGTFETISVNRLKWYSSNSFVFLKLHTNTAELQGFSNGFAAHPVTQMRSNWDPDITSGIRFAKQMCLPSPLFSGNHPDLHTGITGPGPQSSHSKYMKDWTHLCCEVPHPIWLPQAFGHGARSHLTQQNTVTKYPFPRWGNVQCGFLFTSKFVGVSTSWSLAPKMPYSEVPF